MSPFIEKLDSTTTDTFFNGQLKVMQPDNGYRFSIDSVILAGLLRPRAGAVVVDLGTGCGIIPLILAFRWPSLRIVGVEIQPSLADLAQKNICLNSMSEQVAILCRDLRDLSSESSYSKGLFGTVDYVISNPPYHPASSGRINPDPQKALARHELAMNLNDLVSTARKLLHAGGRFILIYPSERLTDAIYHMRLNEVEPKNITMVFSKANEIAKLVVVEGVRAGRPGIQAISSFTIYDSNGRYTPEMEKMFKS